MLTSLKAAHLRFKRPLKVPQLSTRETNGQIGNFW
jgi:hypothetical protein